MQRALCGRRPQQSATPVQAPRAYPATNPMTRPSRIPIHKAAATHPIETPMEPGKIQASQPTIAADAEGSCAVANVEDHQPTPMLDEKLEPNGDGKRATNVLASLDALTTQASCEALREGKTCKH